MVTPTGMCLISENEERGLFETLRGILFVVWCGNIVNDPFQSHRGRTEVFQMYGISGLLCSDGVR